MSGSSEKVSDSKSVQLSAAPAYWVFISSVAVWAVYLHAVIPRVVRGYWIAIGLPVLTLVAGLVGPICRAFGKNVVAWFCGMVVLGAYWTLTFMALFVFVINPEIVLYFWVLAIPVGVITAASTLSFFKREGSTWALLGVGLGLVCSILVMTLWLAERSSRAKSATSQCPNCSGFENESRPSLRPTRSCPMDPAI